MQDIAAQAETILRDWKGNEFIFGLDVLKTLPSYLENVGRTYFLIHGKNVEEVGEKYRLDKFLELAGFVKLGESSGAAPNSPVEDVLRVTNDLNNLSEKPDMVISFGGGSLIDAAKASIVLASLGGECEDYFGVNKVTELLNGRSLIPHVAIITCSASAAHLTKYSNITNFETMQKKLIIDDAVVPTVSAFDYSLTDTMGHEFSIVGALDAFGHLTEVYMGISEDSPHFVAVENATLIGVDLILQALQKVLDHPGNLTARHEIGLASDLGGFAIMHGSTNGPHLNSFSLVDLMDHGKAVGLLNPYYAYFFANSIPTKLRRLLDVFVKNGWLEHGVDLNDINHIGQIYFDTITKWMKSINFPITLGEIDGFAREHYERMIDAAKNPQLSSKLQAMPVPLTSDDVDCYIGGILEAATFGDLSKIKLK